MKAGLVSVSFRETSPKEIAKNAAECGLSGIEWGSDIHVPVGNLEMAKKVKQLTAENCLSVFAYGSYYRLGQPENCFQKVLDTADALGAPVIRIWGGGKSPNKLSADEWNMLVDEASEIARAAKQYNITVALECHLGTITEDYPATLKFLECVSSSHFRTYWQPNQTRDFAYNLAAAKALAPYTVGVHVFHWDEHRRYPLMEGEKAWLSYLDVFRSDAEIPCMLEFMHDNKITTLRKTAETLLRFINDGECL